MKKKLLKYSLLAVLVLVLVVLIDFFKKRYRSKKLTDTKISTAYYDGIARGVGHTGELFHFVDFKGDTITDVRIHTNLILDIGDSVKIRYSVEDPKVAEIVAE